MSAAVRSRVSADAVKICGMARTSASRPQAEREGGHKVAMVGDPCGTMQRLGDVQTDLCGPLLYVRCKCWNWHSRQGGVGRISVEQLLLVEAVVDPTEHRPQSKFCGQQRDRHSIFYGDPTPRRLMPMVLSTLNNSSSELGDATRDHKAANTDPCNLSTSRSASSPSARSASRRSSSCRRRLLRAGGDDLRRGRVAAPGPRRLDRLRALRLQRARELHRGLGDPARLHDPHRGHGVLGHALPARPSGAARARRRRAGGALGDHRSTSRSATSAASRPRA